MRLRPASLDDAPALARLLGDWVRETGWMPVLHTRAEDLGFVAMLIEGTDVTVAGEDAPLGFLSRDGEEVRAFQVAASERGQGIGRALLGRSKARSPRLGLWVFQANLRAVAFYQREGFHIERRTDGLLNEEGLPDIRMVWEATT